MSLLRSALLVLGLSSCAALYAQSQACTVDDSTATATCPQGTSFSQDPDQLFSELASILSGIPELSFSYTVSVGSGTLPPGLTLSPSGLLNGTLTTAGTFSFSTTTDFMVSADGIVAFDETFDSPFTIVVTPYSGSSLTVDPSGLNFNLTQNAAAAIQTVNITNNSNQAVQFSASATTTSGGNWLTISAPQGSIASFNSFGLVVTANPSQLKEGTYSGTVSISIAGGSTVDVSVVAVVAGTQPNLQISQTGERFQAVVGGAATSPQTISVLNSSDSPLNFTASASTISGGNWLSVSPSSGTTSAAASGAVTVSVNPAQLQPGNYYGKVQVAASGASNSPQTASVVLNVLTPANSPGGVVTPTGLIFAGALGGAAPASQTLSITNLSPDPLTYVLTSFSGGASPWFTATPPSGTISSTSPATVTVQPSLQGLQPGFYIGDLVLNIVSTTATAAPPQTLHVEILLVVLPAGTSSSAQPALRPRTTSCTPTQLSPVFTLLGTGFSAAVGWPTAIEVTAVDDCGNLMDSGNVTVTFSSGDPALSLVPLGNGRWTATWNAIHVDPEMTITALAQELKPALKGAASIGGALQPNSVPSVSTGGVVSAANFAANQPLAPGSFGAIFGSNLSQGLNASNQLPLSNQLGGTSVFLGSEQLPLLFASGGQINVVVPYNAPVNSTQQLIVQQGSAISIPQTVVIAPAQPAVFTQNGVGTGGALINVYKSDGTPLPNNSPVIGGDVIVLYCSGLGAVNPPVAAGSPASGAVLSHTVNPVTVMIGNKPGQVSFAGLTPGFAQLYQVNVQIPNGLPSGNATVTVSAGGQQSAPVTIKVQ